MILVTSSIRPELLIPEIVIDAQIHLSDIKQSFYDIICQMEPFGPDNLRPSFVVKKVFNTNWSKVVKENHIRFVLQQDQTRITGIGFNMADKMPLLTSGKPIDIVFKIDENIWNGEKSLQLKVIDFKISES